MPWTASRRPSWPTGSEPPSAAASPGSPASACSSSWTRPGADGLVPVSTLPDDQYEHREKEHALVGRRLGKVYRLGAAVKVKLTEADPVLGSTLFALLEPDERRSGMAAERRRRANGAEGARQRVAHSSAWQIGKNRRLLYPNRRFVLKVKPMNIPPLQQPQTGSDRPDTFRRPAPSGKGFCAASAGVARNAGKAICSRAT